MKKMMTRAVVIALIGATGVAMTGCYGPFRLTNKLHTWNGQVSQKKFVNELVFLAMCIIPAYEICLLGDGLILNSIEWWGGRNPISMKDGQIEESKIVHAGQEYKVIKSKNRMDIIALATDERVEFRYFPEEQAWYQMDGDKQVKVVELKGKRVQAYLPNQKTLIFSENQIGLIEQQVMEAFAAE